MGQMVPALCFRGTATRFSVDAYTAADQLSFALMFVQSNDWFVGTGEEGISLLGDMGIGDMAADVTSQLYLWDAGTEEDEPVGEGPNQAPRQAGPNTGPADADNTVHQVMDGPAVTDLVRVTVTPVETTVFAVYIRNLTDQSMYSTPFAPGVFAVHSAPYILFADGKPNYGNGLEALAEDGNPGEILAALSPGMMGKMDVDAMMKDMDMMGGHAMKKDMDKMDDDGMKKDMGKMDDDAMMMGMPMEEMAVLTMMGLNAVMTMSDEELADMMKNNMVNSMAIMSSMSDEDLNAMAETARDILADLTGSMSDEEIQAAVSAGIEATGMDAMAGMSTDDLVAITMMGMDMVQTMQGRDLASLLMAGMIMAGGDMGSPPMDAELMALVQMGRGMMSDMLMGMSEDDMMNMMLMGMSMMGMTMMEEPGHDMDMMKEDKEHDSDMMKEKSGRDMDMMMSKGKVHAGVFNTPVGMDEPGPLLPGNSYAFAVSSHPSTPRLSLALMFVQSNDWFLSTPAEGVALFGEDGTPMEGIAPMSLYDAGTEEDEPVGEGMNQAPRQSGPNTGPADDDNTVRPVEMMDAADLVRVTVSICSE